jgi:hypothetical protein
MAELQAEYQAKELSRYKTDREPKKRAKYSLSEYQQKFTVQLTPENADWLAPPTCKKRSSTSSQLDSSKVVEELKPKRKGRSPTSQTSITNTPLDRRQTIPFLGNWTELKGSLPYIQEDNWHEGAASLLLRFGVVAVAVSSAKLQECLPDYVVSTDTLGPSGEVIQSGLQLSPDWTNQIHLYTPNSLKKVPYSGALKKNTDGSKELEEPLYDFNFLAGGLCSVKGSRKLDIMKEVFSPFWEVVFAQNQSTNSMLKGVRVRDSNDKASMNTYELLPDSSSYLINLPTKYDSVKSVWSNDKTPKLGQFYIDSSLEHLVLSKTGTRLGAMEGYKQLERGQRKAEDQYFDHALCTWNVLCYLENRSNSLPRFLDLSRLDFTDMRSWLHTVDSRQKVQQSHQKPNSVEEEISFFSPICLTPPKEIPKGHTLVIFYSPYLPMAHAEFKIDPLHVAAFSRWRLKNSSVHHIEETDYSLLNMPFFWKSPKKVREGEKKEISPGKP